MRYTYLLFSVLGILFFSCTKDKKTNESKCDNATEHITFDTPGFNGTMDKSWLEYTIPGIGPTVVGDRLAWLNWDYTANPGIANTIIFEYPNAGLTEGEYPALQVYGLTSYTSPDVATVIECDEESCDNFIITIDVFDEESGYACGTFTGELLDENGATINVEGDFKSILNP